MIKNNNLINKEIDLLFYGTPVIYAISKVIENQSLYAIKDVWMGFLCLQIVLVFAVKPISMNIKSLVAIVGLFLYIMVDSIIKMEDSFFWLISMREMVVTPFMLIIIGTYLDYTKVDYLDYSRKALYFTTVITVVFSILFKSISYGSTNRMSSLWNREHEPAIIGAMLILATVAEFKRERKQSHWGKLVIPILSGGYCIIMSRSRSGILALFFGLIYIFADKLKLKNILILVFLVIGGYFTVENYSVITHRALDYNLNLRLSQYTMAYELIKSHLLFGIGVDKYGILGTTKKVFTYNGMSTITMDSDIIKYVVNLGIVFALMYYLVLRRTYKTSKIYDRYAFVFVVFGLAIGTVTGKMGAYPMNQYFYPVVGYILLTRNMDGDSKYITYQPL